MSRIYRTLIVCVVVAVCLAASGCEPPRVYGSIGVSSYSRYGGYGYGGMGMGTSISIGGRIF